MKYIDIFLFFFLNLLFTNEIIIQNYYENYYENTKFL